MRCMDGRVVWKWRKKQMLMVNDMEDEAWWFEWEGGEDKGGGSWKKRVKV